MEPFNNYFIGTIKDRYAQFDGRASRSEFWYYVLFYAIGSILIGIVDGFLGTQYVYVIGSAAPDATGIAAVATTQSIGYLSAIYSLGLLIPSIAVSIRRLHDTGRSGWWFLLGVIPVVNLIGIFVLLFFYVQDSQPGENEYGPNPKGL